MQSPANGQSSKFSGLQIVRWLSQILSSFPRPTAAAVSRSSRVLYA